MGGNPMPGGSRRNPGFEGRDGSELGVRVHGVGFCAVKQSKHPQVSGLRKPAHLRVLLRGPANWTPVDRERPSSKHTSWLKWNHICFFTSVYYAQPCPTLCDPVDCGHQASPSVASSRSLLRLMSVEWVMPPNHLVLCHPFSSHLPSYAE